MARFHLALSCVEGVGPVAVGRLLSVFPDAAGAFGAELSRLCAAGLKTSQAAAVLSFNRWDEVDRILAEAERLGQQVLAIDDPRYPAAFRTMIAPPPVVFARGRLVEEAELAVTVVGTRQPTEYGERVAMRLGAALAKAGIVTVSGGALGIDERAHTGALSENGRTIAVLGAGLDVIYPPEHAGLFERIVAAGGLLLGEFPPGRPPDRFTFPRRNRLMAGLGRACVVVEAGEKSGALITARNAMEEGKTVLAVPGPIDRAASRGANRLLRDGAKPLLDIVDVTEEVLGEHLRRGFAEDEAFAAVRRPAAPALGGDVGALWDVLVLGPADTDVLVEKTGLSAARVNAALVELEIQGRLQRQPGNRFVAIWTED